MLSRPVLESQQSAAVIPAGRAFPGGWKLVAQRAVTFRPRERSVMEVTQGRIWLTFSGPHRGHGNESGDRFLSPGDCLLVEAGQTVVMEAFSREEVTFRWDWALPGVVVSEVQPARPFTEPQATSSAWQRDVRQPLADLGRALGLGWQAGLAGGQAVGRLVTGVVRLGLWAITGGRQGHPA
ncbi:DUF2917 domain-containing protein [Curvibacter sp. HBC61]|uniref:DUF2917 domain-containing protein n=1 Tax=Curvibacter cyanobacteriorum TaxID=3026422 RepID=A0ABT5N655_9BURK|nr:DUF2917 domain-containing protein [Curvibacter sp. HBC61]MDD0840966.1 DUF2917 domain-containing protein [Curvibacter sp. HBC61]